MARASILVDPEVSRRKLRREIELYKQVESEHIRRGWWMVKSEWPDVFVIYGIPTLKPPAVLCGVLIDFTDYDVAPPSVRLVDPFSLTPYKLTELPTSLTRAVPSQVPRELVAMLGAVQGPMLQLQPQPLMQGYLGDSIPFLCIPGVYEYHKHPGHTGDSWFSHRQIGSEGTLNYVLDTIYRYGSAPISGYSIAHTVSGFQQGSISQ